MQVSQVCQAKIIDKTKHDKVGTIMVLEVYLSVRRAHRDTVNVSKHSLVQFYLIWSREGAGRGRMATGNASVWIHWNLAERKGFENKLSKWVCTH